VADLFSALMVQIQIDWAVTSTTAQENLQTLSQKQLSLTQCLTFWCLLFKIYLQAQKSDMTMAVVAVYHGER